MSQSFCWPGSGQGQGISGPRAASGLLMCGLGLQSAMCSCLVAGVHTLLDEAGPVVREGPLVRRAEAQPVPGRV